MRIVVQRVKNASVTVNNQLISEIGNGLLCLIGLNRNDGEKELRWACERILKLKIFENDMEKQWRSNVKDKDFEVLCVSQFTLYAKLKGKKKHNPDFSDAMSNTQARQFYEEFLSMMRIQYLPERIKDGAFGEMMEVTLTNWGPVTIEFDSEVDFLENTFSNINDKNGTEGKISKKELKKEIKDAQILENKQKDNNCASNSFREEEENKDV